MSSRYSYHETVFRSDVGYRKSLKIDTNHRSFSRIFRLLSGTCSITDEYENIRYKFDHNYFAFPSIKNEKQNQQIIFSMFDEELTRKDISDLFRKTDRNQSFYLLLENEVLNCLIARKESRYVESFLYLYRLLEGICYSIPLIYTSKRTSFNQSYESLRKYFGNDNKDGERAFFKKFIQEVYKDELFFSSSLDINLNKIDIEDMRPLYYKIYKELAPNNYITSDIEDEQLSLTFLGFYEFLIELRNRYFHFLQGMWKKNIATNEIVYPDQFFKPIIDLGINWISIMLFEVLKFDMSR